MTAQALGAAPTPYAARLTVDYPERLDRLTALQARLLDVGAGLVKPGGHLVYAVCSLERQEGERVVAAFLDRRDDYRLDEEHRLLPGRFEAEGGADSFFIARLTRTGP